ncbi:hypothetical protein EYV94_21310 [Puteibacter caeruleilacunae]|nr:hypothetical protein EYV94_21310 [Puteibacter caeruleilacunae]
MGLAILNWHWRYGGFKYGGNLDLNGYYSDEMVMDCEGAKIGDQKYPLSEISSITITYNEVHGVRGWNMINGNFKTNGESNEIIIKMNDGTVIRKYFKIASHGHLKELLRLTVVLKEEIIIHNNWKIRRLTNLMK